jgi:hypothetical protein
VACVCVCVCVLNMAHRRGAAHVDSPASGGTSRGDGSSGFPWAPPRSTRSAAPHPPERHPRRSSPAPRGTRFLRLRMRNRMGCAGTPQRRACVRAHPCQLEALGGELRAVAGIAVHHQRVRPSKRLDLSPQANRQTRRHADGTLSRRTAHVRLLRVDGGLAKRTTAAASEYWVGMPLARGHWPCSAIAIACPLSTSSGCAGWCALVRRRST